MTDEPMTVAEQGTICEFGCSHPLSERLWEVTRQRDAATATLWLILEDIRNPDALTLRDTIDRIESFLASLPSGEQ